MDNLIEISELGFKEFLNAPNNTLSLEEAKKVYQEFVSEITLYHPKEIDISFLTTNNNDMYLKVFPALDKKQVRLLAIMALAPKPKTAFIPITPMESHIETIENNGNNLSVIEFYATYQRTL